MPRISPWAVCTALSVLALAAQPAHVGVFMDFDTVPGAAAMAAMEQEANELLKPSGIAIDWQLARENRGNRPFASLVVVKFKGSCKADRVPAGVGDFGSFGESYALAFTRVSHGKVLPFSEVECDHVRSALRFLRPSAGLKERQMAMGRALGRVVAHELYHIFAGTTHHADHGLAEPSQSLEDLVKVDGPKFRAEDSREMETPAAAPEDRTP
jgi:hypothetical protein